MKSEASRAWRRRSPIQWSRRWGRLGQTPREGKCIRRIRHRNRDQVLPYTSSVLTQIKFVQLSRHSRKIDIKGYFSQTCVSRRHLMQTWACMNNKSTNMAVATISPFLNSPPGASSTIPTACRGHVNLGTILKTYRYSGRRRGQIILSDSHAAHDARVDFLRETPRRDKS